MEAPEISKKQRDKGGEPGYSMATSLERAAKRCACRRMSLRFV